MLVSSYLNMWRYPDSAEVCALSKDLVGQEQYLLLAIGFLQHTKLQPGFPLHCYSWLGLELQNKWMPGAFLPCRTAIQLSGRQGHWQQTWAAWGLFWVMSFLCSEVDSTNFGEDFGRFHSHTLVMIVQGPLSSSLGCVVWSCILEREIWPARCCALMIRFSI